MLQNMEDELFLPHLIFSDEATFHLNGKVKTQYSHMGAAKPLCNIATCEGQPEC